MSETKQDAAAEEVLFAAANSGRGFVSFYEGVFDRPDIKRRYIIKGGPGTGKSSMMKRVAAYAEQKGRRVAYYRCSSDPDSLDGILIDGEIALLDGTAPHAVEPALPGARDELVNLGRFWDGGALAERFGEIAELSEAKSRCYGKAYRYLSAANELEEINTELVFPFLKTAKMEGAARRLLSEIPEGQGYELIPGLQQAIGMKGRVLLDTYERMADKTVAVVDHYGMGYLFLSLLIDGARQKGCRVRVSFQPLMPSRPDGVLFCDSGLCFLLRDYDAGRHGGRVHMRRFVDGSLSAECKSEYRHNRRLCEALIGSAEEALAEAGRFHFLLEGIYCGCMDFEAQSRFVTEFCEANI